MNIRNNTLSLPGLSILLIDKFNDEWDIDKIHKLLKNNKIIGKPYFIYTISDRN